MKPDVPPEATPMNRWDIRTIEYPDGQIRIIEADYFTIDLEKKCAYFYRSNRSVVLVHSGQRNNNDDYMIAFFANILSIYLYTDK